jgi:hypothetical protein
VTLPNSKTSNINACNLLTTLDGQYQFAVWYGASDGELRVGRIQRGVQRWGVNHSQYQMAGAARTELAMPVEDDEHKYPAIAIDDQGKAHIWANMHNQPNRHIISDNAAVSNITAWSAASALPSEIDRNTYPMPVTYPDGTLWFYFRAMQTYGLSGKANSHFWTRNAGTWSARTQLFQGVPTGLESAINDATNYSAYLCYPKVEQRSGGVMRLHLFWIWRQDAFQSSSCVLPSYAYSDDKGATFRAVDGTLLSLPIAPWNNLACQTGIASDRSRTVTDAVTNGTTTLTSATANFQPADVGAAIRGIALNAGASPPNTNDFTTITARASTTSVTLSYASVLSGSGQTVIIGDDYDNDPTLAIDPNGYPHAMMGLHPLPRHHIYWNGSAWVHGYQSKDLKTFDVLNRMIPYYLRGQLWVLGGGEPLGARRPRLWKADASVQVCMGGVIDDGSVEAGPWDQMADPVAHDLLGTVEVLTPDGDTPYVTCFGGGHRCTAA